MYYYFFVVGGDFFKIEIFVFCQNDGLFVLNMWLNGYDGLLLD